ncbi:MAG TPA: DUF5658 family protein [Chloroflexota bacterium]|nr:DUF5658 family protein [Chloroflexota bacterium]
MLPALLYALATAMDLLTTSVALHTRALREGNPLVAPFVNQYGLLPQVAVSIVLCSVLWWYARRGGTKLVFALAIIRWGVVASNVYQLANAGHLLSALP